MRRHKLEIQITDNSNPNAHNFRLIVVRTHTRGSSAGLMLTSVSKNKKNLILAPQGDSACERVFTVNDVSHGGCQYGIMNFGSSRGSLSVEMCDNLYFTNRKVGRRRRSLASCVQLCLFLSGALL